MKNEYLKVSFEITACVNLPTQLFNPPSGLIHCWAAHTSENSQIAQTPSNDPGLIAQQAMQRYE